MPVSLATGLLSDTVRQQSASPDANYSGGMADPFWHSRSQSAYACTDDGAQLLSYPNPQFIQPMTIPTPQAFHIAGVGQMRPQFCQGSSRDLLSQPRGFL